MGYVAKQWVWAPVSGCVGGGAFVIAVILGLWTTSYSVYYSESTDNAGAGIAYFTLPIVGTPVPVIFAILGILAGRGMDQARAGKRHC